MQLFLQRIFDGLNNGAVYAVVAIALVLIFKATTLVNFAQADMAMFGAYLTWMFATQQGWPVWPSIFVAMILINTKEKLNWLVLTIALSIGFYGVKGGVFTIVHGGAYRVQGPPGSFIDGNNELGLALAMTVPLFWYAARQSLHKIFRPALFAAMELPA